MTDDADTAGGLLRLLADADNNIATIRGTLKHAEEEYSAIEDRVFALMDSQETDSIRNLKVGLQASISESETDVIEDYEVFTRFVLRHKLIHFFTRRLTAKALKEWHDANQGKKIPGLGKFKKRRLHVTKYTK